MNDIKINNKTFKRLTSVKLYMQVKHNKKMNDSQVINKLINDYWR